MTTHNWKKGDKVVWVDDNGAQFVGKIVEENWREIKLDFSGYPAYGLLDPRSETKVVRPIELQAVRGDEEDVLWEAKGLAHAVSECITETCAKNGNQ